MGKLKKPRRKRAGHCQPKVYGPYGPSFNQIELDARQVEAIKQAYARHRRRIKAGSPNMKPRELRIKTGRALREEVATENASYKLYTDAELCWIYKWESHRREELAPYAFGSKNRALERYRWLKTGWHARPGASEPSLPGKPVVKSDTTGGRKPKAMPGHKLQSVPRQEGSRKLATPTDLLSMATATTNAVRDNFYIDLVKPSTVQRNTSNTAKRILEDATQLIASRISEDSTCESSDDDETGPKDNNGSDTSDDDDSEPSDDEQPDDDDNDDSDSSDDEEAEGDKLVGTKPVTRHDRINGASNEVAQSQSARLAEEQGAQERVRRNLKGSSRSDGAAHHKSTVGTRTIKAENEDDGDVVIVSSRPSKRKLLQEDPTSKRLKMEDPGSTTKAASSVSKRQMTDGDPGSAKSSTTVTRQTTDGVDDMTSGHQTQQLGSNRFLAKRKRTSRDPSQIPPASSPSQHRLQDNEQESHQRQSHQQEGRPQANAFQQDPQSHHTQKENQAHSKTRIVLTPSPDQPSTDRDNAYRLMKRALEERQAGLELLREGDDIMANAKFLSAGATEQLSYTKLRFYSLTSNIFQPLATCATTELVSTVGAPAGGSMPSVASSSSKVTTPSTKTLPGFERDRASVPPPAVAETTGMSESSSVAATSRALPFINATASRSPPVSGSAQTNREQTDSSRSGDRARGLEQPASHATEPNRIDPTVAYRNQESPGRRWSGGQNNHHATPRSLQNQSNRDGAPRSNQNNGGYSDSYRPRYHEPFRQRRPSGPSRFMHHQNGTHTSH